MPKKHKKENSTRQPCHVPGCKEPGEYKAPSAKDRLREWQWYCLDHIREHNRKWNFFEDMDGGEIEAFMKDAVTGHRPTWRRESHLYSPEALQAALQEFLHLGIKPPVRQPPLALKMRQALALLDLEHPYTQKSLKARYRQMVKQHHPDVNKGDKRSEETFKKITAAYRYLSTEITAH